VLTTPGTWATRPPAPRSVLSQVPKSEAPGAPNLSGCVHFSRDLGHATWATRPIFASSSSARLAVFYAGFYVRVRRVDEAGERCGVCGRSRRELHVTHSLAGALQQAGRIG